MQEMVAPQTEPKRMKKKHVCGLNKSTFSGLTSPSRMLGSKGTCTSLVANWLNLQLEPLGWLECMARYKLQRSMVYQYFLSHDMGSVWSVTESIWNGVGSKSIGLNLQMQICKVYESMQTWSCHKLAKFSKIMCTQCWQPNMVACLSAGHKSDSSKWKFRFNFQFRFHHNSNNNRQRKKIITPSSRITEEGFTDANLSCGVEICGVTIRQYLED